MKPLTKMERAGVQSACRAVRRIADATPGCLEGDELVVALVTLLRADADELWSKEGMTGMAAAAIAALVENERATARGERTVAA